MAAGTRIKVAGTKAVVGVKAPVIKLVGVKVEAGDKAATKIAATKAVGVKAVATRVAGDNRVTARVAVKVLGVTTTVGMIPYPSKARAS